MAVHPSHRVIRTVTSHQHLSRRPGVMDKTRVREEAAVSSSRGGQRAVDRRWVRPRVMTASKAGRAAAAAEQRRESRRRSSSEDRAGLGEVVPD